MTQPPTSTDSNEHINRSGLFILSFQLEGLCAALRHTVPHGLPPGRATVALLRKLYDDLDALHTGRAIERFPSIDDALSPVDVLSIAEMLRSTVVAFLTPEEREERHLEFGFVTRPPREVQPKPVQ
jgi:hypothetical protein